MTLPKVSAPPQCRPTGFSAQQTVSDETILAKLKSQEPKDIEFALDYIAANRLNNSAFLPYLIQFADKTNKPCISTKASNALKVLTYYLHPLQKFFPKIDFSAAQGFATKPYYRLTSDVIINTAKYLLNLPKEMLANIRAIAFDAPEYFPYNLTIAAFADSNTGTVHINLIYKSSFDIVFFHEIAHLRTRELERIGSDFRKRWEAIPKEDVYSEKGVKYGPNEAKYVKQHLIKPGVYAADSHDWKNEKDYRSKVPPHGCLTPYGCISFHEDVSEYVGEINSEPNLLRQLYGRNSIFRQRVKLLLDYGYISLKQYRSVIR